MNLKYPNDPEFFRNLMLQRTNVLFKVIGQQAFSEWLANGSTTRLDLSFLDPNLRAEAYELLERDFSDESHSILRCMGQKTPAHLVSIGPGNGIIETMILQSLSRDVNLSLIDIEQTPSHHHGYARQGSGYANLSSTARFMSENGIEPENIFTYNPLIDGLPEVKFDMVISLLSMGFHYPCDHYVDFILKGLNDQGLMIIDIRKGVQDLGFELLLKNDFTIMERSLFQKHDRILLQRGG
jgi:hypothetical protein